MLLVLAATAVLISLQVFGKVSRDLFLRNPSGLWIGNRGLSSCQDSDRGAQPMAAPRVTRSRQQAVLTSTENHREQQPASEPP
jgi:hypothetical protein